MNREDFEKWVRPYLNYKYDGPDPGNSNLIVEANYKLIKEQFKEIKWDKRNGLVRPHILEENKLIFIPIKVRMKMEGYFVFSDESNMYCWWGGKPELRNDEWAYYPDTTGWSNEYYWIHRGGPISHMNGGEGWNFQSDFSYYTLEHPINLPIKYINWIGKNPLELK